MIKLNLNNDLLIGLLVFVLGFFICKVMLNDIKSHVKNKVFLLTEEQKALVLSYYILGYVDGGEDAFLHLQSKGKDTNYYLIRIEKVKQRLDTLSKKH